MLKEFPSKEGAVFFEVAVFLLKLIFLYKDIYKLSYINNLFLDTPGFFSHKNRDGHKSSSGLP